MYPIIRLPLIDVLDSGLYANRQTKPGAWSRRSLELSLNPDSATNWLVQFWAKAHECAGARYFALIPRDVINWLGQPDKHDFQLAPTCRPDIKGSPNPRAQAMPYSVKRWKEGLYPASEFTDLIFVRGNDTRHQEICGYMSKQEFARRRLLSPHPEYPFTQNWEAGTPFVPITWLHPIEELFNKYGLPKTRRWVNEVCAGGLWATERAWADMKKRGVV